MQTPEVFALVLSACLAGTAIGQSVPVLQGLRTSDDVYGLFPMGVSAEGAAVVGRFLNTSAALWRRDIASIDLGFPISHLSISGNGQVVAGERWDGQAFRWDAVEGMVALPPIDLGRGGRVVASDEVGATLVGWSGASDGFYHATIWRVGEPPLDIGTLGRGSSALAVSPDGLTVVGAREGPEGTRAFRWSVADELVVLPVTSPNSGLGGSRARAVSANGHVIAGEDSTEGISLAVIWRDGRLPEYLGTLGYSSYVTGMSADGSVVVGWSQTFDGREPPFLWTPQLGMVDLNVYLPSLGVDLSDWILNMATGVSRDGTAIVGIGVHGGRDEGWLVRFAQPPSQCVFSGHPISANAALGGTVDFTSSFIPIGQAFQWRKNGLNLIDSLRVSGSSTPQLQVDGVVAADQGSYDCVVTGVCGAVISNAANLSCRATVTMPPSSGEFFGGDVISLTASVQSSGTTTYRWKKDNINLFNSGAYSGVTTPTLTIHANDPSQSGSYTLAITNPCGVTTTVPAIVSVSCAADWNHDGGIDGDDVILFFQQWDENDIGADFTADGSVDGDDVIGFFGRWDLGC
jgi:probable HAF family extracellular repeat protein